MDFIEVKEHLRYLRYFEMDDWFNAFSHLLRRSLQLLRMTMCNFGSKCLPREKHCLELPFHSSFMSCLLEERCYHLSWPNVLLKKQRQNLIIDFWCLHYCYNDFSFSQPLKHHQHFWHFQSHQIPTPHLYLTVLIPPFLRCSLEK